MAERKQVRRITVNKIVYAGGATVEGDVPNTTVLPALATVAPVTVAADATAVTNAFNSLVADLKAKGYMTA